MNFFILTPYSSQETPSSQQPLAPPSPSVSEGESVPDVADYLPHINEAESEFANLAEKLINHIRKMSRHKRIRLIECIELKLARRHVSFPTEVEAFIRKLKDHWDFINTDLLRFTMKHSCRKLLKELDQYESNLGDYIVKFVKICKTELIRPRMTDQATVAFQTDDMAGMLGKILKLKHFLKEQLNIEETVFEGFNFSSVFIYFSFPKECLQSFSVQLLSNAATLKTFGILSVTLIGVFHVNLANGSIQWLKENVSMSSPQLKLGIYIESATFSLLDEDLVCCY